MTKPTPDNIQALILARIAEIAAETSPHEPISVVHRTEHDAEAAQCFANVQRKKQRDGGLVACGWTFHHRLVEDIPGPGYLYLTHHAVWLAPDRSTVVDVTPYPDARHHPLPGPGMKPLFLFDKNADVVPVGSGFEPLPLRFFAIGDDERLAAHVKELNDKEQERHRKILEAAKK